MCSSTRFETLTLQKKNHDLSVCPCGERFRVFITSQNPSMGKTLVTLYYTCEGQLPLASPIFCASGLQATKLPSKGGPWQAWPSPIINPKAYNKPKFSFEGEGLLCDCLDFGVFPMCSPTCSLSLAPHFVPYALPNVVPLGTEIDRCENIYILLMSRVNTV